MTEVEYKGFTICPARNELKDGSGWEHDFYIRQVTASGITSRKITPAPDFFSNTKEEAVEACIANGKKFIRPAAQALAALARYLTLEKVVPDRDGHDHRQQPPLPKAGIQFSRHEKPEK
jgi:hypothetical protein